MSSPQGASDAYVALQPIPSTPNGVAITTVRARIVGGDSPQKNPRRL